MKKNLFYVTLVVIFGVVGLTACIGSGEQQPAASEPVFIAPSYQPTATPESEVIEIEPTEESFTVPSWKIRAVDDSVVPNLKFQPVPHGQSVTFGPDGSNMFISGGVNITYSVLFIKIDKDGVWEVNTQMTVDTSADYNTGQESVDWSTQTMKIKIDDDIVIYVRFRDGWIAAWE